MKKVKPKKFNRSFKKLTEYIKKLENSEYIDKEELAKFKYLIEHHKSGYPDTEHDKKKCPILYLAKRID